MLIIFIRTYPGAEALSLIQINKFFDKNAIDGSEITENKWLAAAMINNSCLSKSRVNNENSAKFCMYLTGYIKCITAGDGALIKTFVKPKNPLFGAAVGKRLRAHGAACRCL